MTLFAATVIAVGYPFVRANPALAFSSFRVQSIRPPWQSIWALLDSFYGYGLVPLDMRNLDGLAGPLWETRLPWTWIGLAFVALYLWLYTRPYDWRSAHAGRLRRRERAPFFLYAGLSPGTCRGVGLHRPASAHPARVLLALLLSFVNFVEANA